MSLSDKQLQSRCLMYQGAQQCRYLDVGKGYSWPRQCNCLKLLPARKKDIDDNVNKHLMQLRAAGMGSQHASISIGTGGSCPGYLYLPSIKQGYDVKP